MSPGHSPPRWMLALLERLLPASRSEFIIGDLLEDFDRRAQANPRQARRRFCLQALATLRALAFEPRPIRTRPRGGSLMQAWLFDLSYSARRLAAAPAFTFVAVLTLALGIGVNTAIFSLVEGILIRSLPYPDADRLVLVYNRWDRFARGSISGPEYFDLRAGQQSFQEMGLFNIRDVNFTVGAGEPERLQVANVTSSFFQVLRVQPLLGSVWSPNQDRADGRPVLLLSHGLWVRRFASDPDIVGRAVRLHEEDYVVAGVLPPGFAYPGRWVDLWRPVGWTPNMLESRGGHNYQLIARLRPGLEMRSAQADLQGIAANLRTAYPDHYPEDSGFGIYAAGLRDEIVQDSRAGLLILLAAVGLVLLIACANLANLQLARGTSRLKELAVRTALGAGRARLCRLLLSESILLGVAGGAAGLAAASWGISGLSAWSPGNLPRLDEVEISFSVLAFTLLISLLAALFSGIVPALLGARLDPQPTLKAGGRTSRSSAGAAWRRGLVAAEVALATLVLISAGLLIRSYQRLLEVEPGFEVSGVATSQLNLNPGRYPEGEQVTAFLQEIFEKLHGLPEVRRVGAINLLPLSGDQTDMWVGIEGYDEGSRPRPDVQRRVAAGDFFRCLEIPLLEGRLFDSRDSAQGQPTVIVNAAAVREYWGGTSPVGRRLKLGGIQSGRAWRTVVGVVGDVQDLDLKSSPQSTIYLPHAQYPVRSMTLSVRVQGNPAAFHSTLAQLVRSLDDQLPLYGAPTLEEVRDASLARPRFLLVLMGGFALLALLLAALGIYGVISNTVSHRRHDIGVGMALGARRADIYRLVLVKDLSPALAGGMLGMVAALLLSSLMTSLLFGVSPNDLLTWSGSAGVLLAVAALASILPARRALRVDPIEALRAE